VQTINTLQCTYNDVTGAPDRSVKFMHHFIYVAEDLIKPLVRVLFTGSV